MYPSQGRTFFRGHQCHGFIRIHDIHWCYFLAAIASLGCSGDSDSDVDFLGMDPEYHNVSSPSIEAEKTTLPWKRLGPSSNLRVDDNVGALAFSPDGSELAALCIDMGDRIEIIRWSTCDSPGLPDCGGVGFYAAFAGA
jgi:hypothetical protein